MTEFAGMYATMKFPPYRHCEYPKWVRRNDGELVLVSDKRAEMDVELAPIPEQGEAQIAIEAQRDQLARELAEVHAELAKLRAERQIPGSIDPKVGPVTTKKVA